MATEAVLNLRKVFEINRHFMVLRQEINAQIINTFVGICIWGEDESGSTDLQISDLIRLTGLAGETVRRNIGYLSDGGRERGYALGLVDTKIHPLDRRQKIVFLTRAGRNLRDQILFTLGGQNGSSTPRAVMAD